MKRHAVIIQPSAERDIGEAYEWIAEYDEQAAIRWYNRLLAVIFGLDVFPERAPLAPESKSLKGRFARFSTVADNTNTAFFSLSRQTKSTSCTCVMVQGWHWASQARQKNNL